MIFRKLSFIFIFFKTCLLHVPKLSFWPWNIYFIYLSLQDMLCLIWLFWVEPQAPFSITISLCKNATTSNRKISGLLISYLNPALLILLGFWSAFLCNCIYCRNKIRSVIIVVLSISLCTKSVMFSYFIYIFLLFHINISYHLMI